MAQVIQSATEAAAKLKDVVDASKEVVFFGGAGVSTASGIPDFRSENGLYNQRFSSKYTPEELLSHHLWRQDPRAFYDFYRKMMCAPDARPNQAHIKLAELERKGRLSTVITQNIDGLHQKAGSRHVIELHGSTHRNYCVKCGAGYTEEWMLEADGIPRCEKCGGMVKPDVVLYEEALDEKNIEGAIRAIGNCDTLIIGGTSLVVYPAAGLVNYFQGDRLVIVNLQPTPQDSAADLVCACDIALAFDW
ncbi:MAG: NAD-dependent protein deacylase [Olsenella sp.]|nr:NAD-dependent protein deacylase [Olsenella sp.]